MTWTLDLPGEVITYYGLWRGRRIAEARHTFERALALDSTNIAALDDLGWIAAMEERFAEGAAFTERMLALQPHGTSCRLVTNARRARSVETPARSRPRWRAAAEALDLRKLGAARCAF